MRFEICHIAARLAGSTTLRFCQYKEMEDWKLAFKFRGAGFVRLPAIKQATAGKTGPDMVALTLQFDGEDGDAATTLSTQMTAAEARDLAIRMWMAAEE